MDYVEADTWKNERPSPVVTKDQLEKLLKANSPRVQRVPHAHGKSELWRIFRRVVLDGVLQAYARCELCQALVAYSGKTGTGSLLRHKCSQVISHVASRSKTDVPQPVKAEPSQGTEIEPSLKSRVPCQRRQEIAEKQAHYASKQLLSPAMVFSGEFWELAQELIDVGADFGRVHAMEALTDERTLTRKRMQVHTDYAKQQVYDLVASNELAFSTDIWCDVHGATYLSLTGHVITDGLELKHVYLGSRKVSNQSPSVVDSVLGVLSEYTGDLESASSKAERSVFVTDSDPSTLDAFSKYSRLSCGCCLLNKILDGVIKEDLESIPHLKQLVEDATFVASYLRQAKLDASMYNVSAVNLCDGWDAIYTVMKYFHDSHDVIHNVVFSSELCHQPSVATVRERMERLSAPLVADFVRFFALFKDCSESLSSRNGPTLNEFVLWKLKLEKHCVANETDKGLIASLKESTAVRFHRDFIAQQLHYVALFLDPNFKSLWMLQEDERKNALSAVTFLVRQIATSSDSCSPRNIEDAQEMAPPSPIAKKSRLSEQFGEFLDPNSSDSGQNAEDEVRQYTDKRIPAGSVTDILQFWQKNTDFPTLKRAVKHVLAVPACSSLVHCRFSSAGRILRERRVMLHPDDIDTILYLHHNT